VVMNSRATGCDLAFAWPSAEFAVMGASAAVEILHRRELAESEDREARKAELAREYHARHANPYGAAEQGYVDDVIDPADTRAVLVRALEMLRSKREELPKRKHGNVPL
jgi:acetyl-CoA carboxylase carboxyltransferase component